MIKDFNLRVPPRIAATDSLLRLELNRQDNIDLNRLRHLRIVRRSIDARQRHIFVNLTVRAYIDEDAPQLEYRPTEYPDVGGQTSVIVVGAGPAGLFAALRLIENHVRPIVLERGKDVHSRRKDIARISRESIVNPESNYAFGEGGAGAFSDGKLYTRSTKRGNVEKILNVFCQHGADTDILVDAHPHIGTDRLPAVIEAMRETIKRCGGEVHFETRVEKLLFNGKNEVCGVGCADGQTFTGAVILATGHSARDVYRMLRQEKVHLEPKGLAIGVRLEHPAALIDRIMYHSTEGRGKYLPAAEYRMTVQVDGRGVYSFCMCPGGFVIPAASGPQQVVVNGMSPSGRNSKWSNSGMVVEVRPEDLEEKSIKELLQSTMGEEDFAQKHQDLYDTGNPLRMMYLQEALERQCWLQAGQSQKAPAQRMEDFVNHKLSVELPESSYSAGRIASPLHFWMPAFITHRLQEGFKLFGQRYRGFLTNQAQLLAIETRTSSPVRISREPETLHLINIKGLYPCGEGAGYAGGIVSAAIDGERCADAACRALRK